MKNALHVENDQKINASLLFFIISASQIGVGIHGFQRILYQDAKQDAWISLILSFALAHIVVFFMMKTLDMYDSNDLYGIHIDIFGKYFGNFLNCIYIFYALNAFMAVLKNYIEVINTWVFPYTSNILLSLSILVIVSYAFNGGFRVIVGISFFSFFLLLWIPPILLFPMKYADLNFLLPILENEFKSIAKGILSMTFTIIGFEILYFCYPFIKKKDKYKRYVHSGMLFTLFLYLSILLLSLTFFSGEQMVKTIWATLSLLSIIRLPFIERIEIISICFWLIVILPNLCFFMWIVYRGVIRMKEVSMEKFSIFFVMIIFFATTLVDKRTQINMINNYFANFSFILIFIYPFLLYFFVLLKRNIKKRQQVKKT